MVMRHFSINELCYSKTANKLGIDNSPSEAIQENLTELIDTILDPIRERWNSPIIVTSGYRSRELNKVVGGVGTSQHLKGEAADILPKNGNVEGLFNLICDMIDDGSIEVGQLINEYNFSWLHISLPSIKHYNSILSIN